MDVCHSTKCSKVFLQWAMISAVQIFIWYSNDYASSSEQLSNVTGTAAEPSSPVYLFDCQRDK